MLLNSDMLRLARQLRGFNQTDAAKRLGMDQSLLSRTENGVVEFRDDLAAKASAAYRLPVEFFGQRDPVYGAPVSVHPMWRRKSDVLAREMDAVVAELNLRVMHMRRLLEGAEIANTNQLPRLDIEEYQSPAAIAGLVRAHWRVPSGPLQNLTSLAEKAGIIVCHSSLHGASISGVTFAVPGMPPLIVLNSEQPGDRLRFTLAHEIGHLIMHRFPTPDMEQEANAFAVALLMPPNDIRPYFVGKKIDLSVLAALKPEWRVSMAALLMESRRQKAVSEHQYTYLWKQISARGYRLREPPELDIPIEMPEILRRVFEVHLTALGYTVMEIAKLFCVHPSELKEFYGLADEELPRPRKFTVLK